MKIVEAVILIPLTILIIVAIIGLMMNFYEDLGRQISDHEKARIEIYEKKSIW